MPVRRMWTRRLKCRTGAWAGMAALAVHLLLSLAQVVPMKSAAAAVGGMPATLVMCVVYSNPDDGPRDGKGSGGLPACPVCLAEVLASGLMPSIAVEALLLPGYVRLTLNTPDLGRPGGRQPLRRLSRAPPAFV